MQPVGHVSIRRLLVYALVAAGCAGALYFATRIRLVEDVSAIMPSSDKLEKLNAFYRNSSHLDKLIVMVSLADSSADSDPQKLIAYTDTFFQALHDEHADGMIKDVTHTIQPGTMLDVHAAVLDNLPLFLTEQDYASLDSCSDADAVAKAVSDVRSILVSPAGLVLKTFLLRDPFRWTPMVMRNFASLQMADAYTLIDGRIFSKDEKHLMVFIGSAFPASETKQNAQLLERIDRAIGTAGRKHNHQVKAEYFGGIAVSVGNAQRIKADITLTVILAAILLAVFILVFVRFRWAIVLMFLPAVAGAVFALAILYFIKGAVSSIAFGIGSILLGIGVDYALYMFSQVKAETDPRLLGSRLAFPILICSITSAAVFLCLLLVETEALQELGLLMALSLVGAALFTMLILPSMIRVLQRHIKPGTSRAAELTLTWFSTTRFDKNITLITLSIVASVVFVFTSDRVEFDKDMRRMSYVSQPLKKAEETLIRINDTSIPSMYVIASGRTLEEAMRRNETVLRKMRELERRHLIRSFTSINTVLVSQHVQHERLRRWTQYWTPEKRLQVKERMRRAGVAHGFTPDAFTDFFVLLEREYQPLTDSAMNTLRASVLKGWIVEADDAFHIMNVMKPDAGKKAAAGAVFESNDDIMVGDRAGLTGQLIGSLKHDFNLLIELSSYIVLFLLIVAFGRLELGLITFVPIVLSWIWTVGIMGIIGENFTIFNIIISTLIFGTGVDYCILVTRGMQREYAFGEQALPEFKAGIFLSAGTTIIGVGVLFISQHPALISIALLPIVGFVSVVIISFTFQPIFLRWLFANGDGRQALPKTLTGLAATVFAYAYFLFGCLLLSLLAFFLRTTTFLLRGEGARKVFHRCLQLFSGSVIYIMTNIRKEVINESNERFEKPAVIVCNHQSVLDILLMLMLSPRLILLTNDWVWNSPFFGWVVRYAQFYPVSSGIENSIGLLRAKVQQGFSIVVFPEGSRSADGRIRRFHKGACYIAEKLNLDILPVLVHGAADTIKRGEIWLRNGRLTVKILERIPPHDSSFGAGYSERTKALRAYMQSEYSALRMQKETTTYYRGMVVQNYLYKKMTLEWSVRRQLRREGNFAMLDALIPKDAAVTELGCGHGVRALMLGLTGPGRRITAIDPDAANIALAAHCVSKSPLLLHRCDDIAGCELPESDVFLLLDGLRHIPEPEHPRLIARCIGALKDNGLLILRRDVSKTTVRSLAENFDVQLVEQGGTPKSTLNYTILRKSTGFTAPEAHRLPVTL